MTIQMSVALMNELALAYEDHDGDGFVSHGDYVRGKGGQLEVRDANLVDREHFEIFLRQMSGKDCALFFDPDAQNQRVAAAINPDGFVREVFESEGVSAIRKMNFEEIRSLPITNPQYRTPTRDEQQLQEDLYKKLSSAVRWNCPKEKAGCVDLVYQSHVSMIMSLEAYLQVNEMAETLFQRVINGIGREGYSERVTLQDIDRLPLMQGARKTLYENYLVERENSAQVKSSWKHFEPTPTMTEDELRQVISSVTW